MPDPSLSDAIKEAYVYAGTGIIFDTLEIWHPSFTTPIYIVNDHSDLNATIEDDAQRNAGLEVTFVRFAFEFRMPELTADSLASMQVVIDNVSRGIIAAIEGALATTDYVTITYRKYIEADLSGPQNDPPLTLCVTDVVADAFSVTATCGFPDLVNRQFPSVEYSSEVFPGLVTS